MTALSDRWRSGGGSEVTLSFDATSRLAVQLAGGVPADVFVSADPEWIDWLEERGALHGPGRSLAGNQLVVLVAPGGADIRELSDLSELTGRLALAGETVPAGRYAQTALQAMGVWDTVAGRVLRGGSVRSILEWVRRGEVAAAIVYSTDARMVPELEVAVRIAEPPAPTVAYLIVPTSADPRASAFVDFAMGPVGRDVFQSFGFREAPPISRTAASRSPAETPSITKALYVSLLVAFLATLLATVPAVGMGWLLARFDFPGKGVVSAILLAPLVLPPVVTGFLLLAVLGRSSLLGEVLEAFGIAIPFTILGATAAALVVGFPLYMMAARGAFEAVDRRYAEVAWTLGDRPTRSFWRVSLPLALPGVLAGSVLAFARALGEFGATVVLAGNIEGHTRTIPLAVYTALESPDGTWAAWVLVGTSVAIAAVGLVGFEFLSRAQKRRMGDGQGG